MYFNWFMFVFVLEVGYEHISWDFAERVVCTVTNYKYNLLWHLFFNLLSLIAEII